MTSRENKPIFVALEGGEGAGKSTRGLVDEAKGHYVGDGHVWFLLVLRIG